MNISLNWLKKFIEINEAPEILAHDLTMFGVKVEEFTRLSPEFEGVVFGKVLEVKGHPRADRLSVCRVDTGSAEPLSIVCGAPNVRAGLSVAVAVNGAVLPGGLKIKRTKLRGEVSEGMICSEKELGIGEDTAGIIELDFEDKPGRDLSGILGSDDVVFDLEVTPNRPDELSHVGIAREVAAMYRRALNDGPVMALEPGGEFELIVEEGSGCPRYTAALIDNVKIGPSPQWMQEMLASVGVKAINNIVDVTNFVMMEMGQPLHAFDRDTIVDDTIIVRRAKPGERIVTLDGVERTMDGDTIVITDPGRAIAIGGVMGGMDTEVRQNTKRIVLESAMFDPKLIRKTSQRLKLETEASYRYEREGDLGLMAKALERACYLIKEIGAGEPRPRYIERIEDVSLLDNDRVALRVDQANRVMGTRLSTEEMISLLERLDLRSSGSDGMIEVSVPTFRRDIKEEIDLVEEVARVYGYDNIGREEAPRCNIFAGISPENRRNEDLCKYMSSRGFTEVITTSFMAREDITNLEWGERDRRQTAVEIENPLTAAQALMRTSLLPGLLRVVDRNNPADQEGIRIFELGRVFIPQSEGISGLPDEELHLVALFTRRAEPLQWITKERQFDFFDMKGEFEALLERFGISDGIRMAPKPGKQTGYIFDWYLRDNVLAEGGLISRRILEKYNIDNQLFYFDLYMDSVPAVEAGGCKFTRITPYPAVKRDLCVISTDRVTFSQIRDVTVRQAKHLESIRLFDYYRGGHLGEKMRSYTFRLSFRSPAKTLEDKAVDKEIEKVLTALNRELRVKLRAE